MISMLTDQGWIYTPIHTLRQAFMPKKASQKLGTERKMALRPALASMKSMPSNNVC